MTKVRKQRRAKKYDYKQNRRRLNIKKKKQPSIEESSVKREWNNQKSIRFNMESMGLSFDPNKSVSKGRFNKAGSTSHHSQALPDKTEVRKELEVKASIPEDVRLRLSEPDTQYVIYMLEKYGDDYKAMARDKRNYYQDTPKQIRKKILTFQKIPTIYEAYKLMKEQEASGANTG